MTSDDREIKRQQELITQLTLICDELGWVIGIPGSEGDDKVSGLIIGTEEFVQAVANGDPHIIEESYDGEGDEIPLLMPKKHVKDGSGNLH